MMNKKKVTFSKYSTILNGANIDIILTKLESNHNTLSRNYYSYIDKIIDNLYVIKNITQNLMHNIYMI